MGIGLLVLHILFKQYSFCKVRGRYFAKKVQGENSSFPENFGKKVLDFYLFNSMENLGLVVDPIIESFTRLEFEDGLRTGVCWYTCGGHT